MAITRFKKMRAMSLLSLLLVLTMIVVVMAASVPMISQNLTRISKGKQKAGETDLAGTKGYFMCYYNSDGQLCHKQVETDQKGEVNFITGSKEVPDGFCCDPADSGCRCRFIVPETDGPFEITLVGGGGGGGMSTAGDINLDNNIKTVETEIGFDEDGEMTIPPKTLNPKDYYYYQLRDALFQGETILNAGNCGNTNIKSRINSPTSTIKCTNTNDKGHYFTSCKINKEEVVRCEYSSEYGGCNRCSAPGGSGSYSSGIVEKNSQYGIKFNINGKEKIVKGGGNGLKIRHISAQITVKEGKSGSPGAIRNKLISTIEGTKDGETKFVEFTSANIGRGGAGATPSEKAKKGGSTVIIIDGTEISAAGGEAGQTNTQTYSLDKAKINYQSGENGKKSSFYIPSQLGVNQSKLLVGTSPKNGYVSEIEKMNSTYPGSGGASSGYQITNNHNSECISHHDYKQGSRIEYHDGETWRVLSPSQYDYCMARQYYMGFKECQKYACNSLRGCGTHCPSEYGTTHCSSEYGTTHGSGKDKTTSEDEIIKCYEIKTEKYGGKGGDGAITISW